MAPAVDRPYLLVVKSAAMTEFLAWAGTIGTFAFGSLSVFQFLRDFKAGAVLQTTLHNIETLQASLSEACNNESVAKTEEVRQLIRQTAWHLAGIRLGIESALGRKPKEKTS